VFSKNDVSLIGHQSYYSLNFSKISNIYKTIDLGANPLQSNVSGCS